MSDLPSSPQPEQAPTDLAGRHGLIDGQFRVRRSAKDEKGEHLFDEGGWALKEVYHYTDPQTKETDQYARIDLPDGRFKSVKLADLLSWQPKPEAGIDEDTIPREVLDRVKQDLMDMGEPPVEEEVEIPQEESAGATPGVENSLEQQIEEVKSGAGNAVHIELDPKEPEKEVENAKDESKEKSREILDEIFGARQEVERSLDTIHAAIEAMRRVHLKTEEKLEHFEGSLKHAHEALSVAIESHTQPSHVRYAQEASQEAMIICKDLAEHVETLHTAYEQNLGKSTPYHQALDKFVVAHARITKEISAGKEGGQTAEHMAHIIDVLYKADAGVSGTDRLLVESMNDLRRLITNFNSTVQYEGVQNANPDGLRRILQAVQDIMSRTGTGNNSLLAAKNGVIELNDVVMRLYR